MNSEKITELIQDALKNNHSKLELAKKIGINRCFFDNFGSTTKSMNVDTLEKIASFFNVKIGYFFDEEEGQDNLHKPIHDNEIGIIEQMQLTINSMQETINSMRETINTQKMLIDILNANQHETNVKKDVRTA